MGRKKIHLRVDDDGNEIEDVSWRARIVAGGDKQEPDPSNYAPIALILSIRLLVILAATTGWFIEHFDVTKAYLECDMPEGSNVYLRPPRVLGLYNVLWLVKKAVYGLRESGRLWADKMHQLVQDRGWTRLKSDPCMYVKNGMVLVIWVDDIFILYDKTRHYDEVQADFAYWRSHVQIRSLGQLSHALGIDFTFDESTSGMAMTSYFTKLAKAFNLDDTRFNTRSPLPGDIDIVDTDPALDPKAHAEYRTIVGVLVYASYVVRADIAFATHFLSRHLQRPTAKALQCAKHVLKYCIQTKDVGPKYYGTDHRSLRLYAYSDSDWAQDPQDRRSVLSAAIYLGEGLIDWSCGKFDLKVSLSTAEAEYYACCETSKRVLGARNTIIELSMHGILVFEPSRPIPIYMDNKAAIAFANDDKPSKKMRHIELRRLYVQDLSKDGVIACEYVATNLNRSDINTKRIEAVKFPAMRDACLGRTRTPHPGA